MTSYSGTTLELTHPNGTTEELQHNSTSVTFTDLSPATNYDLMVTFRFAGDFIAESNLNGSTMEDGKSHDSHVSSKWFYMYNVVFMSIHGHFCEF